MTLEPLGDRALIARHTTDEAALAWAARLEADAPPWLADVVVAYSAVGVHLRDGGPPLSEVLAQLAAQPPGPVADVPAPVGRTHVVPVCYERGPDLGAVAQHLGLSAEAVIALHQSVTYRVRAVGFVPGFAYLGDLPAALAGVPRLPAPRVRVEPGSVGVTGRQTGVYPLPRPGGWPLIGQTPRTLVDVAGGYFPLAAGDAVTFTRVDEVEFTRQRGRRL